MYNASKPEKIEEAERLAKYELSAKLKFVQEAMNKPEGRKFFYDLLAVKCNVFASGFTGDNNKTNYACGQRDVGLRILADIQEAAPEEYVIMCQEGRV